MFKVGDRVLVKGGNYEGKGTITDIGDEDEQNDHTSVAIIEWDDTQKRADVIHGDFPDRALISDLTLLSPMDSDNRNV